MSNVKVLNTNSRSETVRMLRKLADDIESYGDTGQGVLAVTVTLNETMDRIDIYGAGAGCDKHVAIGMLMRGVTQLASDD